MINKIVVYVISTGALSAILHAACLITVSHTYILLPLMSRTTDILITLQYITMSRKNIVYAAIYIVVPECTFTSPS